MPLQQSRYALCSINCTTAPTKISQLSSIIGRVYAAAAAARFFAVRTGRLA